LGAVVGWGLFAWSPALGFDAERAAGASWSLLLASHSPPSAPPMLCGRRSLMVTHAAMGRWPMPARRTGQNRWRRWPQTTMGCLCAFPWAPAGRRLAHRRGARLAQAFELVLLVVGQCPQSHTPTLSDQPYCPHFMASLPDAPLRAYPNDLIYCEV